MSTSNYLGTQWHDLLLNAVDIPNIADSGGTASSIAVSSGTQPRVKAGSTITLS